MQMNASSVMIRPWGCHQGQPQQCRQDDQRAEVEHHHGRHEQPRRAIAFLPVIDADEQHAQASQGDQARR